jgi:hypothetical protein
VLGVDEGGDLARNVRIEPRYHTLMAGQLAADDLTDCQRVPVHASRGDEPDVVVEIESVDGDKAFRLSRHPPLASRLTASFTS